MRKKVAWFVFWLFAIITLLVSERLSMLALYMVALYALAVISAGLGLWVLIMNRFAWHSVTLVMLGLIVGQWRMVEFLAMWILWSIGSGFAP